MRIFDQIKSGTLADPSTFEGAVLYAIVFAFFAWLVARTLRLAVQRFLARHAHGHVDRTAVVFLSRLVRFGVYIFAFLSYAHVVPALSSLGKAGLASVGVLSVIAGLAAQNTLGNLIAGISLLLYRPFKLGDRLQVSAPTGLETGTVESLSLGYTRLKTDDNRRVVIPNSIISSQTTINLTGDDPRVICSVPIGISYDSDIDKARAILLDLARKNPKAQQVCDCPVTQLAPSSVVLTLDVWCADAPTAGAFKSDLLEQAKRRFADEGIQIPFPHTTVILQRDFDRKLDHATEKISDK